MQVSAFERYIPLNQLKDNTLFSGILAAIRIGVSVTHIFTLRRIYFRKSWYYTIIDFNEADIRIYLPEKVMIHRGR